jgi:hypothetical protein
MFMASGQIMEAIGVPLHQWLEKNGTAEIRAEVKTLIEQLSRDSPYARAFAQVIKPRTQPDSDISAQIREIREKVEIFTEELRAVLQHHHLLLPIAGDDELISRFSATPRERGLQVLLYHMIRADIVSICRISFDEDNRVVSAHTS